jgi:hypothetical protein
MPENDQQAKSSNGKSAVKNSCKKALLVCDFMGEGDSINGLPQNNKNQNTMKILTKLALAAVILCSTFAVKAQSIYGTSRTYGNTTYHNYYNTDGGSAYGTSRNYGNTTYHNLYDSDGGSLSGTSRSYGNTTYQNYYNSDGNSLSGTSRSYGNTTYHNYYDSDGGMITGTTRTYGNTSYTTLNEW